jgi:hypothetical protein
MAYVYQHIRLDTDEVFYIGIGSDTDGKYSRAWSKTGRNDQWKSIVNSVGYRVEIIEDSLTKDESIVKEKQWIERLGRKDIGEGILVNLTDGGEGLNGWVKSEEQKEIERIEELKAEIVNWANFVQYHKSSDTLDK